MLFSCPKLQYNQQQIPGTLDIKMYKDDEVLKGNDMCSRTDIGIDTNEGCFFRALPEPRIR